MARHIDITADLGAPIYFCDSHSPWQRASNENSNGLLCQYFPKGTDVNGYTSEHSAPSRSRSTAGHATFSETAVPHSFSPRC